ncbi:3D domain-containing protein [Paenibacillus sp. RC343]|uniref:3D domain-containing protein n=1 Tax=Paenibacillus sp. RC343 TaxID=3045841 RepID=UPI0024BAE0EE|nr:3D domain-containing protein [Paenibacillus sp. RC343]
MPIRLLDAAVQNKSTVTPSLAASTVESYTEYSMEAWAYYVNAANSEGITRGGTDVRQWKDYKIIAVDPSVIPLGSKVELLVDGKNWGEYVADDTAGSTKGKRIEILMENAEQCLQFGRKPVIVKIKQWGGRKNSQRKLRSRSIHCILPDQPYHGEGVVQQGFYGSKNESGPFEICGYRGCHTIFHQ